MLDRPPPPPKSYVTFEQNVRMSRVIGFPLAILFAILALAHAHVPSAFRSPAAAARSSVGAPRTVPVMTVLNINGKLIDAPAGSNLGKACEKGGLKPKYSCKKGECNSCVVTVAGTRMKACVDKVPPIPKLKSLIANGLPVK